MLKKRLCSSACTQSGGGGSFLTQQEKAEIDLYIKKYFSASKDRTIRILSRMILGNRETVLHVLGKIQRMLVNYQQRR